MTQEKEKLVEQEIKTDKLNSFIEDKSKTHLTLFRTNEKGDHIFLNGYILKQAGEKVWILREDVLGEIRVHISEIKKVEGYRGK